MYIIVSSSQGKYNWVSVSISFPGSSSRNYSLDSTLWFTGKEIIIHPPLWSSRAPTPTIYTFGRDNIRTDGCLLANKATFLESTKKNVQRTCTCTLLNILPPDHESHDVFAQSKQVSTAPHFWYCPNLHHIITHPRKRRHRTNCRPTMQKTRAELFLLWEYREWTCNIWHTALMVKMVVGLLLDIEVRVKARCLRDGLGWAWLERKCV